MKLLFIELILLAILTASCTSKHPKSMAATTLPSFSAMPIASLPTRVSTYRSLLLGAQQRYLVEEGITHRGSRFEDLLGVLDKIRKDDGNISEFEVLALLGPPELGGSIDRGAEFVYFYTTDGVGRIARIYIHSDGLIWRIGYNLRAAVDLSNYPHPKPYPVDR